MDIKLICVTDKYLVLVKLDFVERNIKLYFCDKTHIKFMLSSGY